MPLATTSIAAYHTLDLAPILEKVYEAIEKAGVGGLTCDEIAEATGIEYRTVTPRIVQLEKLGLVYRAGDTRPGPSGRAQKVTRDASHLKAVPMLPPKPKKNAFLEGMKFAAKVVLSQSDFDGAKRALKTELIKVASK